MPTPEIRYAYELVGRVTAAWNDVEVLWYLIFTCLMHETPRDKLDAAYHQFQTFAMQRQLIMAIAGVALPEGGDLRREIGRLFASTNEVSGMRNAIVHGNYSPEFLLPDAPPSPGLRVAPGINPGKPNRFAGKPLTDALMATLDALAALTLDLSRYLKRLEAEFLPPEKRPPPMPMPPEEYLRLVSPTKGGRGGTPPTGFRRR